MSEEQPTKEELAMALRKEIRESLNPVAKELAMRATASEVFDSPRIGSVTVVDALITEFIREIENRVGPLFDRLQFCKDMNGIFNQRVGRGKAIYRQDVQPPKNNKKKGRKK